MRPALGSMVPPTYCGLRHMPCQLKAAPTPFLSPWDPASFSPAKMLPVFDYFFVRNLPPGFDLFRGYHRMVELLAQSGNWMVFRKRPGPLLADPLPPPAPPPVPAAAPPVVPPPPAAKTIPRASAGRR
jgi:hypothetical protein